MGVPESLAGGCQCGACRYEITAAPLYGYVCHCLECRRQTSSAFGASVVVAAESMTVDGPVAVWVRENHNGPPVEAHFCSVCGTRLLHHAVPRQDVVRVKVGTLDDASWFQPAAEFFTERRMDWVQLSTSEEWGH